MLKAFVLLSGATLACASMAGCLVASGKSVRESGIKVSGHTLRQVEPGSTTREWLIATLGEPSAATVVQDWPHTEVMRYEHVKSKSEGGTVLFLFAGGSDVTEANTTFFELVDGVVTRAWTESGVTRNHGKKHRNDKDCDADADVNMDDDETQPDSDADA